MRTAAATHSDIASKIELWVHFCLLIPASLTTYFFGRVCQLPNAVNLAAVLLVVTALYFFSRAPATAVSRVKQGDNAVEAAGVVAILLAVLILIISVAPAGRYAWLLGGGGYPGAFLNADESYNFMIAQGLAQAFPPPDLTYSGRVSAYHLGGPMLAEMLNRFGGVSLHLAFYGVWPVVMKVAAACSIFCILGKLAPVLSTTKKLLGVLATSGVFTVDFYNIVWSIRSLAKTGVLNAETVFAGMPVATGYVGFIGQELQYAAPLAIALFLVLVANLERAGSLLLATGLVGIFLAKSSVFAPIAAGWGAFATYHLLRHRDYRYFVAGVIALGLCLIARPYVMEAGMASFGLGGGYGLDWLAGVGAHPSAALGLRGTVAAAVIGMGLLVVGSHIFGWAGALLVRDRCQHRALEGPLLLIGLSVFFAALFCAFFVFRIDPVAQAGFYAIHEQIKSALWLGVDTYIYEMGKFSVGEAKIVVFYGLGLIGISGVLWVDQVAESEGRRAAAWVVLWCAIASGCWQSYEGAFGPLPNRMKVITAGKAQALASIPVAGSVILTNECAYDRKVELHMPLMNAAMAAVYGHQFWACQFMFGNNFAVPDAPERLRRIQWFWAAEIGDDHLRFLRSAGITHLLLDRGASLGSNPSTRFDKTPWLDTEIKNSEYIVYKINRALP
ncbi:MAG: hypothetical protein H7232_14530 [Aeromicrobium sp.]|nr:hypothetical protein [Burkholderiales bacterium]